MSQKLLKILSKKNEKKKKKKKMKWVKVFSPKFCFTLLLTNYSLEESFKCLIR